MQRLLLLLALLGVGATAAAEAAPDPRAVVDRYQAAIAATDWVAMAALLAPDAHYEDRTMAHFDRPAIDLRGPEAIVEFWRAAAEQAGSSAIRYEIQRAFVAGPVVVLTQRALVENDGAAWDMPGFSFTGEVELVSLFEVEDGRIRWHMDAADYAASEAQVESLRRAFEAGREPPQ